MSGMHVQLIPQSGGYWETALKRIFWHLYHSINLWMPRWSLITGTSSGKHGTTTICCYFCVHCLSPLWATGSWLVSIFSLWVKRFEYLADLYCHVDPNPFGCSVRLNCGNPDVLVSLGYPRPDFYIEPYNNPLGHNVLPRPFRYQLWVYAICNMIATHAWELLVVLGPVRNWIRKRYPVPRPFSKLWKDKKKNQDHSTYNFSSFISYVNVVISPSFKNYKLLVLGFFFRRSWDPAVGKSGWESGAWHDYLSRYIPPTFRWIPDVTETLAKRYKIDFINAIHLHLFTLLEFL